MINILLDSYSGPFVVRLFENCRYAGFSTCWDLHNNCFWKLFRVFLDFVRSPGGSKDTNRWLWAPGTSPNIPKWNKWWFLGLTISKSKSCNTKSKQTSSTELSNPLFQKNIIPMTQETPTNPRICFLWFPNMLVRNGTSDVLFVKDGTTQTGYGTTSVWCKCGNRNVEGW